eukprot:2322845-Amphidinium_carterae.1
MSNIPCSLNAVCLTGAFKLLRVVCQLQQFGASLLVSCKAPEKQPLCALNQDPVLKTIHLKEQPKEVQHVMQHSATRRNPQPGIRHKMFIVYQQASM